ncbi:MAG: zinc dependent phospholipase C family protein [Bacillota bacterium]|nr:zinc dependent phospholipase C family protein [Bacillota bacterium]
MPAVISHYLCGQDALSHMKGNPYFPIIKKHENLYNLGTQGPDLFFFCMSLKAAKLGKLMHKKDINQFYERAIAFIKTKNGTQKDKLYAYLCGFLSHYALDTIGHPFVYYFSGFSGINGELSGKFGTYHRRFEATLDTVLTEKLGGTTPYSLNVAKKMNTTKQDRLLLAEFFNFTSTPFQNSLSIKRYKSAAKGLPLFYTVMRDKYGWKKSFIYNFERAFSYSHSLSAAVHYQNAGHFSAQNVTNNEHKSWCVPWDKQKVQNSSFFDLFHEAAYITKQYSEELYKVLYQSGDLANALKLFGNKCFNSGLEEKVYFRYHKSIYE